MPNRRQVLQAGVTVGAWPLAAAAARAAHPALPEAGLLPIYKVIFDRRHAHSGQFGARAADLGLATAAIDGDMTRLWYEDVHKEWRRRPIAIAGFTEHGPLFCFEQLARDSGMRVVFRAEHRLREHGGLAHALVGPRPMLDVCTALDVAGERWPEVMAEAIASTPISLCEIETATRSSSFVTELGADRQEQERLYSWVIAPV